MLEFVPHPHRSKLGFTEAVKQAFEFLREHGFAVSRVDEPTRVRFERNKVFLDVVHGRGDYVVTAEIGRRLPFGLGEDVVTIYEVIGSLALLQDVEVDQPAETAEEVRDRVAQLARTIATFAGPWLKGETRAFRMARRFRSRPDSQPQRLNQPSHERPGHSRGDHADPADADEDDSSKEHRESTDRESSRLTAPAR